MKRHKIIWFELCEMLSKPQAVLLSKASLYASLSTWLEANIGTFGPEISAVYGFDSYVNYDPSDYPTESCEFSAQEIIHRIISLEPSSLDSVAMIIRDTLWDLIAYKSNRECLNCGDDDFRVLYDGNLDRFVMSCDLCGCSVFDDGSQWLGDPELKPANVRQLKANGYLSSS